MTIDHWPSSFKLMQCLLWLCISCKSIALASIIEAGVGSMLSEPQNNWSLHHFGGLLYIIQSIRRGYRNNKLVQRQIRCYLIAKQIFGNFCNWTQSQTIQIYHLPSPFWSCDPLRMLSQRTYLPPPHPKGNSLDPTKQK